MDHGNTKSGIGYALTAAVLFGVSTPLAKQLLGQTPPLVLAGLLYLGSGVGLFTLLAARRMLRPGAAIAWPAPADLPWLAGAIGFGGVAAPVLLLLGLARTSASSASLLLNLEAVFTAALAWLWFHENADRRIVAGMAAIVAGGVVLVWSGATETNGLAASPGAGLIAAACLCWALDNNLTRKAATGDATVLAGLKGLVGAGVNLTAAAVLGLTLPGFGTAVAAGVVGFLGYGASLALFILALRHLGTARTGAYFALGPFFGAVAAVALQHDPVTVQLAGAGALMALGVWLHLTERHAHAHTHEPLTHTHAHVHDEHHQHVHAPGEGGAEPHVHEHRHEPLTHTHAHYPDIHHRHGH